MKEGDFKDGLTQRIAAFLNAIGIEVVATQLIASTFLPGVAVKCGKLLVDETKLSYPGDLLHEAGHLAVAPASLRPSLSDEVMLPNVHPDVLEVEAIAWSYAACVHLGIDPRVVFQSAGLWRSLRKFVIQF